MFEEYTTEKKPPLPPPPEDKPSPKPEVKKDIPKDEPLRERDMENLSIKEDRTIVKDRDRYSNRTYVAPRTDYPTPSSSDMGYGTSQSDSYSTTYGSTNTTPLG